MKSANFYQEYRKIVIPLMLQGLVTNLVAMIDNLMVGQLGDHAISAVAVSLRIVNIMTFTMFGITAAAAVFIAQYYGAKIRGKQQEVFRVGLILSLGLVVLVSTILLLFPKAIVHFFVQDALVEQYAVTYIRIMLIGFIPFTFTINYGSALKVIGQVRLPLVAALCGVAVNTTINYILIFGNWGFPRLGVAGAAIATVISRCVELLIVVGFTKYYHFHFDTRLVDLFKVPKELMQAVIKKAVPLASNEVIWSIGMATILKIYASRGSEVIAAYSIFDTTSTIFWSVSQGMAAATPVLVSQRLGAGQFDEAWGNAKAMVRTIFIVALGLGVLMWGASYVVPNFYQVSQTSHDLAQQMIQLSATLFWVYLVNTQCYFIIRAGGDMRSTLMIDGIFMWGFTIPVTASVAYFTSVSIFIIYIVGQLCDMVKLGVSLRFFWKRRWIRNLTQENYG